ncbi:MAG: phytoene/squalene synthase family protein [Thermomicrobiales bacterium]|nr:phytoene/squalene synthase family protein [Thermomicrobiales bacterium]
MDEQSRAEAALCREIARSKGRSFYLASFCLAPDQRRAIHAVYAYCRVADDIVDLADRDSRDAAERKLDAWRDQLHEPVDPVARAFARARAAYGIPLEPALALIEGVRGDLSPESFFGWPELRRYCHKVAGTVGLLTAPVLGCRDPRALPRADELGIAMQLTNIVRDVAEDAAAGRVYLPFAEMRAFGCDPEALLQGRPTGDFAGLVALQVDRARGLYRSALRGVPALDRNGQLATLAAARLYGEILGEIERANYDVFRGRTRVSGPRKLRQAPVVAADFIRSAFGSVDYVASS